MTKYEHLAKMHAATGRFWLIFLMMWSVVSTVRDGGFHDFISVAIYCLFLIGWVALAYLFETQFQRNISEGYRRDVEEVLDAL